MRLDYRARFLLKSAYQDLLNEQSRYFYWCPVLIAMGIGLYFMLHFEPPLWPSLAFMAGLLAVMWHVREKALSRIIIVVLISILAGFLAAQFRTLTVQTVMLNYDMKFVQLEGTVIAVESLTKGSRLLLDGVKTDRDLKGDGTLRLRITMPQMSAADLPPAGSRIRLLASLSASTERADPYGYDFRRQAFFEGISGYGYGLGKPEVIESAQVGKISYMAENGRQQIAGIIRTSLSGPSSAIAIALMTGERGDIDTKTNDDMRAAGTAHLLSISGMHIGMVGGIIFYLVRLMLALLPGAALRWPIKKIAAGTGLVTIVIYTWLVGSPVPAERAALMTGLVFVAIMLDRISLTLRAVVLAAIGLLLLQPESLLHPGFQLSFAAITGLVSFYEWFKRQDEAVRETSWLRRLFHSFLIMVATSLIAAVATAPIAAFHFHRLQMLGLLGNLIAVPLTGLVVMPAMLLAYAAMPFGLADWPLKAMALGLEGVTESAAWVAGLPGANIVIPQFGLSALLLMVLGGLWFSLWQRSLRLWGLLPFIAGMALAAMTPQPVALISTEGVIALRMADDHLYYSTARKSSLTVKNWSLAYDQGRAATPWKASGALLQCDALGCVVQLKEETIALPKRREALLDDCTKADIIIAPLVMAPAGCASRILIDRRWTKLYGSTALYQNDDQFTVVTSRTGRGLRPWFPD